MDKGRSETQFKATLNNGRARLAALLGNDGLLTIINYVSTVTKSHMKDEVNYKCNQGRFTGSFAKNS